MSSMLYSIFHLLSLTTFKTLSWRLIFLANLSVITVCVQDDSAAPRYNVEPSKKTSKKIYTYMLWKTYWSIFLVLQKMLCNCCLKRQLPFLFLSISEHLLHNNSYQENFLSSIEWVRHSVKIKVLFSYNIIIVYLYCKKKHKCNVFVLDYIIFG